MGEMGEVPTPVEFMGDGASAPGDWTMILGVRTMPGHMVFILE
jgi:hypothetical protein